MKKRIIPLILTIICMACIFAFSAQTAPESDSMSKQVSAFIKSAVSHIPTVHELRLDLSNSAVRKYAHFTLYFFLGLLSSATAYAYMKERHIVPALTASAFCFLWSIGDELHQMYVPGRGAQTSDVMTDMAGALAASLLVLIVHTIVFFSNRSSSDKTF